ncbi:hypothetical protein UlMin_006368 [Ulmus minor]
MQHLLHNIKNKSRGISVDILYYRCAKAYRLFEFESFMHALTLVQPRLGPYLQEVEYERWSRAYSEVLRYNIMTTNISECINVILIKERELPIIALAEEMRCLLDPASNTIYTVFNGDNNGVIDLQAQQLPCTHAMIAIRHKRGDVYEFYSDYYSSACWKATYAGVVYPLPHQGDWVVLNKVRENKVLPPDIRSTSGHRRECQIPSIGETVQRHKCSHCRPVGHHYNTCQNLIPLHQNQASALAQFPSSGPSQTI